MARPRRSGDVRSTSKRKPTPAQAAAKPDDAVLVPIDPDQPDVFLLLSSQWLDVGERLDVLLPSEVDDQIRERLRGSASLANIGLQGLNGLQQAQGLVRLAPETLAAMRAGAQPLVSGGYNLGALSANGRIAAQVRWLPATGATVTAVLAAIGPAIALAAIQLQLAAMDRKLDRLIRTTDAILRATRVELWSTVQAEMAVLSRCMDEARHIGAVTDHIYNEANGAWRTLHRSRLQLTDSVNEHSSELSGCSTAKSRRQWFADSGGALISDVQCLMLAWTGCLLYDELRAEHLRVQQPEQAAHIRSRAIKEYWDERSRLSDIATTLDRQMKLLVAEPGSRSFQLFGKDRSPEAVQGAAQELSRIFGTLGVSLEVPIVEGAVTHGLTKPTSLSEPVRTLGWHLRPGERLVEVWKGSKSTLVATDYRVMRTDGSNIASLKWSVPWTETQEFQAVEDWGDWNLHVVTKDGNRLDAGFPNRGEARQAAQRLAELVQARAS